MMKLRIACATDDGRALIDRHFGDAEEYAIYDLEEDGVEKVKTINNTTAEDEHEEEETHADPEKANSVKGLLKREEVEVLLSQAFGPNIVRVKKHFLPVVVDKEDIDETLKLLQDNFSSLVKEWERGKGREHLVLK